MRVHRIIFLAAVTWSTSCAGTKQEVEAAKHSLYDADFATVYGAALEATRESYPNLEDAPGRGAIKTAWHQVTYGDNSDNLANPKTLQNTQAGGVGASQSNAAGMPTRLAYKRYFIRFDVSIAGGRPWRLKVVGHAAEWEPGATLPTEMHGAQRPTWLDGRSDALISAIYKKVKQYAVPMKEPAEGADENSPKKSDPSMFKDVPPAAAKELAVTKDALNGRDYTALRAQLADDVIWSLGGGTGADAAMAMWQADPDQLTEMGKVLTGGCGGDAKKVTCPAGAAAPGAYQLTVEPRGEAWRVTSFVKAE